MQLPTIPIEVNWRPLYVYISTLLIMHSYLTREHQSCPVCRPDAGLQGQQLLAFEQQHINTYTILHWRTMQAWKLK